MNQIPFLQLNLSAPVMRALEGFGFENATDIQAQSIPLIRDGYDVIGRSQTGTGKTIAFGIPAVEMVNAAEDKTHVQVLILCPTRELAMQACEEINKLAEFMPGIHTADIYGGAPMDRQILKLKRANIVIGTPGRVMDHMRRKTLKLANLKMIVLDEADEMLSMGFREDIETVLQETPAERQTILFSATMPPSILALTREYQKEPQLIEIDKKQVTVDGIEQCYYDVPMGRKMDALNLLLRFYNPVRSMIFCNTKRMAEEIGEYLGKKGFDAQALHGDMNQSQRTKVMEGFKSGHVAILVCTDVAARGIDVNDIEYVINYDIPQNTEYYVHRIGRTGRAGKTGIAVTMCSGRRQVEQLMMTGRMIKSKIVRRDLPNAKEIREKAQQRHFDTVADFIRATPTLAYTEMVEHLSEQGFPPEIVAAAVMELHFGSPEKEIADIAPKARPLGTVAGSNVGYSRIVLNIGRSSRVAPNHIVGAITERTNLSGRDIGKIEIFDERSLVGIPVSELSETLQSLQDLKICGRPTTALAYEGGKESAPAYRPAPRRDAFKKPYPRHNDAPRHTDAVRHDAEKDYRALSKKRFHKDEE